MDNAVLPPKSVVLFVTAKTSLIPAKAVVLLNIVFIDRAESIANSKSFFC
ncbi:MAG TPA: hypothetical protein VLA74_11140 [Nitrososphaeraceae archaeon]|nr:hypothetical protein [Nitrososphaeraceae archaeon]